MNQFALSLISALTAVLGALLLLGEWLCVEIAWYCLDYNIFVVTAGTGLVVSSIVVTVFNHTANNTHGQ